MSSATAYLREGEGEGGGEGGGKGEREGEGEGEVEAEAEGVLWARLEGRSALGEAQV